MRTAGYAGDADKPFLIELPDQRSLHFWEGGDPAGTPIIYHGGVGSGRLQARLGDEAARRQKVRLISFSRPGYGLSTDTRPSLASVGADTLRVADALGVAEFAVLGQSGGGPYAIATGLADPGRVRAVGIASGLGPWLLLLEASDDEAEEDRRLLEQARAGDVPEALEGFRAQATAEYGGLLELDDADLIEALKATYPAEETSWLDAAFGTYYAADKREALRTYDGLARDMVAFGLDWDITPTELNVPTWLWYGDQDQFLPASHGQWLAERIPASRLIIRPGKGYSGTAFGFWDDMFTTLRDEVGQDERNS